MASSGRRPRRSLSSSDDSRVMCLRCTFLNHISMTVCELCGEVLPNTKLLNAYTPNVDLPSAVFIPDDNRFSLQSLLNGSTVAHSLVDRFSSLVGLRRNDSTIPVKYFTDVPVSFLCTDCGSWTCSNPRCSTENSQNLAFCSACKKVRSSWFCDCCKFHQDMSKLECEQCCRRNPFLKYTDIPQDFDLARCINCLAPIQPNSAVCPKCLYDVSEVPPKTPKLPKVFESDLMENLIKIDEHQASKILESIKELNQWGPFVDPEFPPGPCALVSDKRRPWTPSRAREDFLSIEEVLWFRPQDIRRASRERLVVYNNPSASMIQQGRLGNCYQMSAVALVVQFSPSVLDRIFLIKEINSLGVYQLRLCVDGQHQIITIDDHLPCTKEKFPVFAQIRQGQLFAALLEKAFAKIHGCYNNLKGGSMSETLAALTGDPVEQLELSEDLISNKEERDMIWGKLLSWKEQGYLIAASCGNSYEPGFYESIGLVSSHGYSVMDVRIVSQGQQGSSAALLRLRNPWAQFSWRGDWSDNWPGWTDNLCRQLDPTKSREGIFWISLDDVLRYFVGFDVCKIGRWSETRIPTFLAPYSTNSTYGTRLTILETCEVILTVHQPQGYRSSFLKRKFGTLDLMVILLEDSHGRIGKLVSCSKRLLQDSVSCEEVLQPGTYWLVTTAFNHWSIGFKADDIPTSIISIHSAKPILVEQTESILAFYLADALIRAIKRYGKRAPMQNGFTCYCLEKNASGAMIMVENLTARNIVFECEFSALHSADTVGLVSTRRSLKTVDIIPPSSLQIVNILTRVDRGVSFSYQRHSRSYDAVDNRGWPLKTIGVDTVRNQPYLSKLNWGIHARRRCH